MVILLLLLCDVLVIVVVEVIELSDGDVLVVGDM